MDKNKGRKSSKPVKRLDQNDTLVNKELIRKISLSSPSTSITLNPAKTVKELRQDFEGKDIISQTPNDDPQNEDMNTGEMNPKLKKKMRVHQVIARMMTVKKRYL